MSTTGTKEKRTKIEERCPPHDILSNTKARRAWLASELAKVQATPNRDGKIVGVGSYQRLSVYEVIQVEGRVRYRGICQCCGNDQVVDTDRLDDAVPHYIEGVKNPTFNAEQVGTLVMHGYKRPGDGYLVGRCPGAKHAPLNASKRLTEAWALESDQLLAQRAEELAAAQVEEKAAKQAKYGSEGIQEEGAHRTAPAYPRVRYANNPTEAEKIALAQYATEHAAWEKVYPITARLDRAERAARKAHDMHWYAKQQAEHFHRLLTQGTFGTELEKEVVA
jgi:hypothetical protein